MIWWQKLKNFWADTVGEGEGGLNWESRTETYALAYVKQIPGGNVLCKTEVSPMLCESLEGWGGVGGGREIQEGEGICIPMAGSCWYMPATNTLWSNYPPIKNKFKKRIFKIKVLN